MSVHKNFSPFGPAVWPDIGNIHMNVLFYYIDYCWSFTFKSSAMASLRFPRPTLSQPFFSYTWILAS